MPVHDIGDTVRLWIVFRDEAGAQADPTAVTLAVIKPGSTTSEAVTNTAAIAADETLAEAATGETLTGVVGVYKATVDIDTAGVWSYRWEATGAVAEVSEGSFSVWPRRVPAV